MAILCCLVVGWAIFKLTQEGQESGVILREVVPASAIAIANHRINIEPETTISNPFEFSHTQASVGGGERMSVSINRDRRSALFAKERRKDWLWTVIFRPNVHCCVNARASGWYAASVLDFELCNRNFVWIECCKRYIGNAKRRAFPNTQGFLGNLSTLFSGFSRSLGGFCRSFGYICLPIEQRNGTTHRPQLFPVYSGLYQHSDKKKKLKNNKWIRPVGVVVLILPTFVSGLPGIFA